MNASMDWVNADIALPIRRAVHALLTWPIQRTGVNFACSEAERALTTLPDFEPRLRALFPALGPLRRQPDQASLAHVLELATLALQIQAVKRGIFQDWWLQEHPNGNKPPQVVRTPDPYTGKPGIEDLYFTSFVLQ